MSQVSVKNFNCEELISFLEKHGLSEFGEVISSYDIDGAKFLKLTELDLRIWRPKITQAQIRKLWNFIVDVTHNLGKYENSDLVVFVDSRAPLSKQTLSKLYKDDKFMNILKSALSQKQEKPVLADTDDSEQEIYENYDPNAQCGEDIDQELYENAGPLDKTPERPNKPKMANKNPQQDAQNPTLPPKPKVQPHAKIAKQTNQMGDDYLKPSQFEQNARNTGNKIAGAHLKPSRLHLERRPDLNLKPTDLDEDYLEPDIPQKQPQRKPSIQSINQQETTTRQSIPEYLDMEPKRNANHELKDFNQSKLQPPQRLQVTKKSSSGHDVPELMKKPTNQPNKPPQSPSSTYLLREKARRPPSDDDDEEVFQNDGAQSRAGSSAINRCRKNSIQGNPLPALPAYDPSSLPRPPKNVPDLEELKQLGYLNIEEFNFEQSFVAKYSSAKFYRYTDKKGAEELLSRPNTKDGTYLLRPSHRHYCALAVRYHNRVYNVAIAMGKNNKITQCGKEFKDVEEMLEYFRTTPLRFKNSPSMNDMLLRQPLPMNIT